MRKYKVYCNGLWNGSNKPFNTKETIQAQNLKELEEMIRDNFYDCEWYAIDIYYKNDYVKTIEY